MSTDMKTRSYNGTAKRATSAVTRLASPVRCMRTWILTAAAVAAVALAALTPNAASPALAANGYVFPTLPFAAMVYQNAPHCYGCGLPGIDSTAVSGTSDAVLSISDGTVLRVDDSTPDSHSGLQSQDCAGDGYANNQLIIQSTQGLRVIYSHLAYGTIQVQVGDEVQAGQVLGTEGATGCTTPGWRHLWLAFQFSDGQAYPLNQGGVTIGGWSLGSDGVFTSPTGQRVTQRQCIYASVAPCGGSGLMVNQGPGASSAPGGSGPNTSAPTDTAACSWQVAPPSWMVTGAQATVVVACEDTGQVTWYGDSAGRSDVNPVRLGTTWPGRDATTPFATPGQGWLGGARVEMDQAQVNPGQTATFTFVLTAPGPGDFELEMAPVLEAVNPGLPNHWFSASVGAAITVVPSDTDLGGVDLNAACVQAGYQAVSLDGSTAYDWHCVDSSGNRYSIDVIAVCQQQYGSPNLAAETDDPSNPYSWQCWTT